MEEPVNIQIIKGIIMTWKIETEWHNCAWLYIYMTSISADKKCWHEESEIGYCQEETCPIKIKLNKEKK